MLVGDDLPENASRDVATTTNGDHEVGVELFEDGVSSLLAQLVHLEIFLVGFMNMGIMQKLRVPAATIVCRCK